MQQRVGILVVIVGQGYSDRGIDLDLPLVPGDRPLNRGDHFLGEVGERVVVQAARREDDELVAAESGHRAPRRNQRAQPVRDGAQHGVSGGVAVNVVDRLEAIEIDQHHRERCARISGGEGGVEPFVEKPTVGETRQRVVTGGRFRERFGGHPRLDRSAEQHRLTDRGDDDAQAHAAAEHDEIHQVVFDGIAGDALEDAELDADVPNTGSHDHESQQLIELAFPP